MVSLVADPTKGVSEEQIKMAEEFLKKFPAEKLVQVLKNSNSLKEIFQDVPFFYAQFTNFIAVTQSLGDTRKTIFFYLFEYISLIFLLFLRMLENWKKRREAHFFFKFKYILSFLIVR